MGQVIMSSHFRSVPPRTLPFVAALALVLGTACGTSPGAAAPAATRGATGTVSPGTPGSPTETATPAPSPSPAASAPPAAAPATSLPRPAPPSPQATMAVPTGAPPVPVRTLVLGQSVKGRPITAVEFGDPAAARTLLVVGCIHGNEPAGIAVARRLEQLAPPQGTAVWVIEVLNPDGLAAGTRQNADGVDLNRNFPYAWQPLDARGGLMYSGPSALSEPESKLAVDFLDKVRPNVTIWYHQHEDLVDLSGGDASIETRYASMVGLRTQQLQRYPGSATSWENHMFAGTTAFVVELPAGSLTPAAATHHAMAALKSA